MALSHSEGGVSFYGNRVKKCSLEFLVGESRFWLILILLPGLGEVVGGVGQLSGQISRFVR